MFQNVSFKNSVFYFSLLTTPKVLHCFSLFLIKSYYVFITRDFPVHQNCSSFRELQLYQKFCNHCLAVAFCLKYQITSIALRKKHIIRYNCISRVCLAVPLALQKPCKYWYLFWLTPAKCKMRNEDFISVALVTLQTNLFLYLKVMLAIIMLVSFVVLSKTVQSQNQ